MKVTFIHTGDLHIGRQFHFKHNSDIFGRNKRTDMWHTFELILNTAEKNQIDLLLIAGDFFDSEEIDLNEIHRAADLLGRLSHTRVVILPGNHDFYNSISVYGLTDWPKNVTILRTGKMESVYFPDLNTEVFGLGWRKDTYNEMPLKNPVEPISYRSNILMLHGDVYHKKSDYMPIDVKLFRQFDYVALGHFHQPDLLDENVAYCGCPQALDFGDSGARGFIFGELENHHCSVKLVRTDEREYITRNVTVTPEMRMDDVKALILKEAQNGDNKGVGRHYYRFILEGYCDLELSVPWLYEELKSAFYYLEIDDSALEYDLDIDGILANNENNVIGRFIREMREHGDDPVAKKALRLGLEGLLKEGRK